MKTRPMQNAAIFRAAVPSVAKSTPANDIKVSAAPRRIIPGISSLAFTRELSVRYLKPRIVAAMPMGILMKKMYSQPK